MHKSKIFRVIFFLILWILLLVIITNTSTYLLPRFTMWSRSIQTSDESVGGFRFQAERDNKKSGHQSSHVTRVRTKQLHSESESTTLRNSIVSDKTNNPSSNDVPNKNDAPLVNDIPFRTNKKAHVLVSKYASSNRTIPKTTEKVLVDKLDSPRYRFPFRINDNAPNKDEDEKYLIYRCDDGFMKGCGGWTDRLKGILTGFIIANLTGRTFKAELLAFSCPLEKFLVPNVVNWSLPHSFHKKLDRPLKLKPDNTTTYFSMMNSRNTYKQTHLIKFSISIGQAKFAYFKANLDHVDGLKKSEIYSHQLSWMKNLTRDVVYAKLFPALFKPSPALQSRLDLFFATARPPGHRLICAHVRMGRNPTFPKDGKKRHTAKDLPVVWEFLKNQSGQYPMSKIFVMSDSNDVLQRVKNQSFAEKLVFTNGTIVHIELSKGSMEEKCQGLEKVILEQQILMHCDVLMISNSGVSRMAAYVRQRDGLFCFVKKEIVKCETSTIKELYGVMG